MFSGVSGIGAGMAYLAGLCALRGFGAVLRIALVLGRGVAHGNLWTNIARQGGVSEMRKRGALRLARQVIAGAPIIFDECSGRWIAACRQTAGTNLARKISCLRSHCHRRMATTSQAAFQALLAEERGINRSWMRVPASSRLPGGLAPGRQLAVRQGFADESASDTVHLVDGIQRAQVLAS